MYNKKILKLLTLILLLMSLTLSGCSDYQKEKLCGTHTETYTSSAKGCDNMENCRCLHQSWAGLGACDSCECSKEVSNC